MGYFKFLSSFFNYKSDLMDYFNRLSLDITLDILSRVPAESILQCKLVCKNWRSLISNHPSLSKMHFNHLNHPSVVAANDSGKLGFIALTEDNFFYYFEYNENQKSRTPIRRIRRINFTPPINHFMFVGSCNGLICLYGGNFFWISNPITKECVMLPELKRDCCKNAYAGGSSFGYVSSTDDYKIVRIYKSDTYVEVHIYTLGSGNVWRNLGKFNFKFSEHWRKGIFSNGTIYWLNRVLEMIITFDLAEEKFCEHISLPPSRQRSFWCDNKLWVLDGFLSIRLVVEEQEQPYGNDIWLLKKKNDIHGMREEEHQSLCWSKEFRVDSSIDELLTITKSDCVLTYDYSYLHIYNTKISTSKRLVNFNNGIIQVSPHKNTLISLKELGEEDTRTMESVRIEERQKPMIIYRRMRTLNALYL